MCVTKRERRVAPLGEEEMAGLDGRALEEEPKGLLKDQTLAVVRS